MRICAVTELEKGLARQARSSTVADPAAEEPLKQWRISSSRLWILDFATQSIASSDGWGFLYVGAQTCSEIKTETCQPSTFLGIFLSQSNFIITEQPDIL